MGFLGEGFWSWYRIFLFCRHLWPPFWNYLNIGKNVIGFAIIFGPLCVDIIGNTWAIIEFLEKSYLWVFEDLESEYQVCFYERLLCGPHSGSGTWVTIVCHTVYINSNRFWIKMSFPRPKGLHKTFNSIFNALKNGPRGPIMGP